MSTLDASVKISLLDYFTLPLRRLNQALQGVGDTAEKTGKKAKKNFNLAADLNQASEAVERFAGRMRSVVERPFTRFTEYQQDLVALKNVGNLSDEVLANLSGQIKSTSKSIGLATGEIAASYETLIAANFGVEDLAKISREAINLGKGNRLDTGAATELMVGVMQSFGKGANDASHVGNVLAAADDVSTASASMLGDFLSRLGATARPMGIQMEDVASIGAILKDSGLKDLTEASTSVRNIITRLASPTEAGAKALTSSHGLGFSRREVKGLQAQVQSGDIFGAIARITAQFDKFKVPELERGNIIKQIFGEGQEMGIFTTLAESVDKLREKSRQFREDVEGTTERKAENADNSVAGRLAKMRAQWDVLLVDLGERLTPVIMRLSASVTPMIEKLGKWIEKNPELTHTLAELSVWFAGFAVVAAPIVNVLASMATFMGGLGKALPVVKAIVAALAGLSGPGLLLAGALATIVLNWDKLGEALDWVGGKLFALIKRLKDPFGLDDDNPKPLGKLGTGEVRGLTGRPAAATTTDDVRSALGALPAPQLPGVQGVALPAKTVDPVSLGLTLGKPQFGGTLELRDTSNRDVTREQTSALTREMRIQQKQQERLLEEIRGLRRRGGLPSGGSNRVGGF